ncbi:MAG: GTP pyrophosphokinase [Clostridiales bacterium]|nr:GTP pyrophosphokinase [Clostridiales bacterium]
MIYTELTKRALRLCYAAHRDQTDKSGLPYVFHPFHLAEQMPDETTTVVALLHDVVEDTDYTLDDLAEMGYPAQVLEALALLTHDPRVPYLDYVARIRPNPVARAVKLADLRHNSDLTRLDRVGPRELQRVEKYQAAIRLLETPEEGRGAT